MYKRRKKYEVEFEAKGKPKHWRDDDLYFYESSYTLDEGSFTIREVDEFGENDKTFKQPIKIRIECNPDDPSDGIDINKVKEGQEEFISTDETWIASFDSSNTDYNSIYCNQTYVSTEYFEETRNAEKGIEELRQENEELQQQNAELTKEKTQLQQENDGLKKENKKLKERFLRVRNFITERCARSPFIGKSILIEMQQELGEKELPDGDER